MKTIILLFLCLFFLDQQAKAQTWQSLPSQTQSHLFDVVFINPQVGYVTVNDGTYLKTDNAGITWSVHTTSFGTAMTDMKFFGQIGFASGLYGRVFKTTNEGLTWTMNSPTGLMLRSIDFINANTGVVVGDQNAIFKTTNGGGSWIPITTATGVNLTGIKFVDETRGFISGVGSTNLLLTTDAGATWLDRKIRGGQIMSCGIDFLGLKGYVGGYEEAPGLNYNPLIFSSTNGGETWSEYKSTAYGQVYAIAVSPSDPDKACAVGQYINDPVYGNAGLIMRTIDGGQTWTEEAWGSNQKFRAVTATDNAFYVVGNDGIILKSDQSVGISTINNEIPENYTLSQNYPNPFNPVTKIKFAIPQNGTVTLKVYNMSGKEIMTLVNEAMNSGTYETEFDGSNLSTGTYFYRIQAGDFVNTKKMILIK